MVLKSDEIKGSPEDCSSIDCGALIKYKKFGKYLVPIAEVSPETGEVLRLIERGRPYEVE